MALPTFVREANLGGVVNSASVSGNIDTTGLGANGALVVHIVAGKAGGNMTGAAFSTPTLGGSSTGWTEYISETINAASVSGMMGTWVCLNPSSSASISLALAFTGGSGGSADRIAAVIGMYSDVASVTTFGAPGIDNDGASSTSDTMTNAAAANALTVGSWSHGSALSSVTSGTLRGSINNAVTDYANGCLAFIEGNTAAFSSGSSDTNIGLQIQLNGTSGGTGGDPRQGATLFHPGSLFRMWRPPWAFTAITASSDVSVFANCAVAVASSSTVSANATCVATETVANNGAGTITHGLTGLATEGVAVSESATAARGVDALAAETVGVASTGSPSHDVTAVAVEAVAVSPAATHTPSVTAVATEQVAVSSTGTITRGLTTVATENVAVAESGTVTRDMPATASENVAVASTGTLTTAGDISVFARCTVANNGAGTITHGTTATGSATGAVGASGTITRGTTANGYLSIAVGGTGTQTITDVSVFSRCTVAAKITGVCTYTTAGALPPLVPPFAAILDGYLASTVNTTPRGSTLVAQAVTATVNTTPRTSTIVTSPQGVT